MSIHGIVIVTGGSENLLGPAAVLFLSIQHRSSQLWNNSRKIFFLESGKRSSNTQQNIKVLESLGVSVHEYDSSQFSTEYSPYFTAGISSKFISFKYISDAKSVLWLDSDQICSSSIDFILTIHNNCTTSSVFYLDGGLTIADQFLPHTADKVSLLYPATNLKAIGMCGSIWMITYPLPDIYSELANIYNRLSSYLRLPDQAVLDIYASSNSNRLKLSWLQSPSLLTPHPRDFPLERLQIIRHSELPYLLHSYGYYKFWSGVDHSLWDYYYKKFLGIRGRPFKINSFKRIYYTLRSQFSKTFFSHSQS